MKCEKISCEIFSDSFSPGLLLLWKRNGLPITCLCPVACHFIFSPWIVISGVTTWYFFHITTFKIFFGINLLQLISNATINNVQSITAKSKEFKPQAEKVINHFNKKRYSVKLCPSLTPLKILFTRFSPDLTFLQFLLHFYWSRKWMINTTTNRVIFFIYTVKHLWFISS